MQPRWLMALLVLLKEASSARRDAHIRFLKLQVEMLRSHLPGNRIILDPIERKRLMRVGAETGHAIEHTLEIVSIKTYRRWLREEQGGRRGRSGVRADSVACSATTAAKRRDFGEIPGGTTFWTTPGSGPRHDSRVPHSSP